MGPFIVRPTTPQSEVERIVNLLRDDTWSERYWQVVDSMHRGRFQRLVYRQYSGIACSTCGWQSEGPVLDMDAVNYQSVRELHHQQRRVHRAEFAVADQLVVPD